MNRPTAICCQSLFTEMVAWLTARNATRCSSHNIVGINQANRFNCATDAHSSIAITAHGTAFYVWSSMKLCPQTVWIWWGEVLHRVLIFLWNRLAHIHHNYSSLVPGVLMFLWVILFSKLIANALISTYIHRIFVIDWCLYPRSGGSRWGSMGFMESPFWRAYT